LKLLSRLAPTAPPVLAQALVSCRRGFAAVVLFSACINLLLLAAPLYMLQVFDRVVTSRSMETLIYLTGMALAALVVAALLDVARTRVMVWLSLWLDERVGTDVLAAQIAARLRGRGDPSVQGLRDLSTVRSFLTGPAIFPFLDAPWSPVYLLVVYLLHPALGWLSLAGAVVLFGLALANDAVSRRSLQRAGEAGQKAMRCAETAVRNANVVEAMGMLPDVARRWQRETDEMLDLQAQASRRSGNITAASKFARQGLQIGVLGLGAWLFVRNELSPGGMVAASILMSRALAPVELAIGSWRTAVVTQTAYRRLGQQLAEVARDDDAMALPAPTGRLKVEGATFYYSGASSPTLTSIEFELQPGEVLGLIGATAAGKTTLAELLVGNLRPQTGHVRLDGGDIGAWPAVQRGRYIGYLPQDIELFSGSVRDNIARMGEGKADAVVGAARLAGVHDMILRMPKGYETEIGDGGAALSGGQRQRLALARAVYGRPRFVVLDEPNASLDTAGEQALVEALEALKRDGVTVVVISHRPSILRQVDMVLVLRSGAMESFGPRDEVMPLMTRPARRLQASGQAVGE
jgi:PrtD family type I secretion system ABC transporter